MDLGFGNWPTIQALRNAGRPAFIDADTGDVLSYRDLEARTNALADALRRRGVRRGDRVATLTLNSPQMMEVLFAVAKIGAIGVPINFRLSAPEVAYVLQDSGACVLFESSSLAAVGSEAAGAGTSVRERITIPDAAERADGRDSAYERLVTSGDTARHPFDIAPDDICLIMYTSGTTGRPKGAMLTHRNVQWNVFNSLGFGAGIGREDITLSAAPLFHIGALGVHTMPFTYLGACTVIMESFTPGAWLEHAETHRITKAFLVPAMWAAIAQDPSLGTRDLSSLSFAVSGGAPCPIVVIKALQERGMAFTEGFGMTETAPVAACLQPEEVIEHAGSIGKPVAHMDFRIVDEHGHEAPTGQVGELAVRGPNVFVGYWNSPDATAEALRGEWFHTGDLGIVDEGGYYRLVDRLKDMIITGGENVYPIEVEQVIYEHPDVLEVAVVGTPDEKWGEAVVAVVAPRPDAAVTPESLIEWTRARIAHFKAPQRVELVDQLPRNATGKILKRELRRTIGGSAPSVNR